MSALLASAIASVGPLGVTPSPVGPAASPLVRTVLTQALNWSGYASTSGPFSSVSGAWRVPKPTCTQKSDYSAFWVGIDGDGSGTVEQTGVAENCLGGAPQYFGWYEMFPAGAATFSNTVNPGDLFRGSVTAQGETFTLTLTDETRGWTRTEHRTSANARRHSAEAIAEAPCCSTGKYPLPLTDFGTVSFTGVTANGSPLGDHAALAITMVTSAGTVKAEPSTLSQNADFTITWHHW